MGRMVLIGVLLLLCSAPLAQGQSASLEPVRLGDPDVMRTLREVYPDLGADGQATQYKGVRVLPDSVDGDADKPGTVDVDLRSASQATVTIGPARYFLLMAENQLIVAEITPAYRFLDAVAVQTHPGGPPSVTLEVVEEGACRNGDRTTPLPLKRVSVVLTWNVATMKYVGGEKELASLARRPQ